MHRMRLALRAVLVGWIGIPGAAQLQDGEPQAPPAGQACTTFSLDACFGTRYAYTLKYRSLTGSYGDEDESALLRAILSIHASSLGDREDWSTTLASLWSSIELIAPHERSSTWTLVSVDREIHRFDEVRNQLSLLTAGPDYILKTDGFTLHYIPADSRVLVRPRDWRVGIDDLARMLDPFPEEVTTPAGDPSWLAEIDWQVERPSAADGSTRVLLRSPDGVGGLQGSRFEVLFSDAPGAMLPIGLCSSIPGRGATLLAVEYEKVEVVAASLGLFPSRVLRLQTIGAKVDLAEYEIQFNWAPANESEVALPIEQWH